MRRLARRFIRSSSSSRYRPHSGGTAFDALSNLRAALDQAGFATAIAAGRSGSHAKLPFGDNIIEAKSRVGSQSKGVPPEISDVMIAFQPYKGGNNLLWALNKACNTNKHEIVVPIIMSGVSTKIVSGEFGGGPLAIMGPKWDSAKQEAEIKRVGRGAKANGQFEVTFLIAFGNIEGVNSQEVVACLNATLGEVERVLVAIEVEAVKIGLFG
jgi:hypothetical protein